VDHLLPIKEFQAHSLFVSEMIPHLVRGYEPLSNAFVRMGKHTRGADHIPSRMRRIQVVGS
jgi:hypothetical protein